MVLPLPSLEQGGLFAKEIFADMLSKCHCRGCLNKESNATFLTLIPEVPYLMDLKDFWPIILVGHTYKLVGGVTKLVENVPSSYNLFFPRGFCLPKEDSCWCFGG